jgi:hypothetical protein
VGPYFTHNDYLQQKWAENVAQMGRSETHVGYWWESHKEKSQNRPKCRQLNNIKMDFGETGWGGMEWINLAQDRDQWKVLVNTVMNL